MWYLYRLGIVGYVLFLRFAAVFHPKARAMLRGRRHWRRQLRELNLGPHIIWIHAASLGEMEQGLPIAELLREKFPQHQLLFSFFSPSGYQNFKQQDLARAVIYLPFDTASNARDFVNIVQPRLAVFVKYDLWAHYLQKLQQKRVPILLAPALFRPRQWYFRRGGRRIFLPLLRKIDFLLVQDRASQDCLAEHGIEAAICGDTRFDRVKRLSESDWEEPRLPDFLQGQFCVMAGSSWPAEEKIVRAALREIPHFKLVLAPHEVQPKNIERLALQFAEFGLVRYSEKNWNPQKRVLLIDNIGLLSKLYRYAHLAFVGGGLGQSVHSTIEPAVYGIPLCFGPAHRHFVEPGEMLVAGHAREIHNSEDFTHFLRPLLKRSTEYQALSQIARHYLSQKTGAISKVEQALVDLKLETVRVER